MKKAANPVALFVALDGLFSNQILEDLDRLWAMRYWIPDPNDPSTWR